MITYVMNGTTGLGEYSDMLGQHKRVIAFTGVAYFPEFSIELLKSQFGVIDTLVLSVAYIFTRISTVKMLFLYIKKPGKSKFWIIKGSL